MIWIFDEDETGEGSNTWKCSECGETITLLDGTPGENNYHYCPNCGAKAERNAEETLAFLWKNLPELISNILFEESLKGERFEKKDIKFTPTQTKDILKKYMNEIEKEAGRA